MTLVTKKVAVALIAEETAIYLRARRTGDIIAAWRALENGHIISQPYLRLHIASHWTMLGFAINRRDPREVAGQFARLVLAPLGYLTGRVPVGNSGRSNVSAFLPMTIPADLRAKIDRALSNANAGV